MYGKVGMLLKDQLEAEMAIEWNAKWSIVESRLEFKSHEMDRWVNR